MYAASIPRGTRISSASVARAAVAAGVLVWVLNASVRFTLPAPLGHDEARYALDARDLLAERPTRFEYSAGAMALVPIPGLIAGGGERALRVLPFGLGLAFLAAVWLLARRQFGEVTAGCTIAILATSPQMAVHGSELLSDLPSAACLLFAVALLVTELTRPDGARWRVVCTAPLAALAFYFRYGSSAPILVIGLVFGVAYCRQLIIRPWPILATLLVFLILLTPHIAHSIELTGSPIGILQLSASIPGKAAGLSAYLAAPLSKYGVPLSLVLVCGVLSLRCDRTTIALWGVAVGQIALLAATTQAQPRFIYLATVLLTIIAVAALVRLHAQLPRFWRHALVIVGATLVAASSLNGLANSLDHRDRRIASSWKTHIAAMMVRGDHVDGQACEVVTSADATRLEWYSGCRAGNRPIDASRRRYEVRDGATALPPWNAVLIGIVPGHLDVIRYDEP